MSVHSLYLITLQKHGFVKLIDGHLLCISRTKIPHKKGIRTLPTRPYTSYGEILNRIYFIILMNNKAQQEFKIATNYGKGIETLNPRTRKKALRHADLKSRGLESSDKAILSTYRASKLFNISKTTTHKILKNLQNKRYINLSPLVERIGRKGNLKYLQGYLGHFFITKYGLYRYLGSQLTHGRYLMSI